MCLGYMRTLLRKYAKPYFNGGHFRKKDLEVGIEAVESANVNDEEIEVGGDVIAAEGTENVDQGSIAQSTTDTRTENEHTDVVDNVLHATIESNIAPNECTDNSASNTVPTDECNGTTNSVIVPNEFFDSVESNVELSDSINAVVEEPILQEDIIVYPDLEGANEPRILYDHDAIPNVDEISVGTFTGNARVHVNIQLVEKTIHVNIESVEALNYSNTKMVPRRVRFQIAVPNLKYRLMSNWTKVEPSGIGIPPMTFAIQFEELVNAGDIHFKMYGRQRKCFSKYYGKFSMNLNDVSENSVVYVKRVARKKSSKKSKRKYISNKESTSIGETTPSPAV